MRDSERSLNFCNIVADKVSPTQYKRTKQNKKLQMKRFAYPKTAIFVLILSISRTAILPVYDPYVYPNARALP